MSIQSVDIAKDFATKSDLENVRNDLSRDFQTGLAELETKIERSKVQIFALVFAIVGFFFALDRFLT